MKKFYLFFACQLILLAQLAESFCANPPVLGPTVNTVAPTNMNILSVRGRGQITSTNGFNATNRGVVIYSYTDTDKIIGESGVTNFSADGDFGTGSYNLICTGLSANTHYNIRAHATNPNGTGYGSRMDFWTLAKAPSAPAAGNATLSTLDLVVMENGNPAGTEYCITESGGQYVQSDGSLGASPYWQSAALWDTVTITGLTPNSGYTFFTRARNGFLTETVNSPGTSVITGITIYVDMDATSGTNSGESWINAFLTLQQALNVAISGQQIWVAEGTYYPTSEIGGTGDRYKTFQMVYGVAIYGGFDGTESILAERDIAAHLTVLSGDLGVSGDSTDNCYHVFYHRTAYLPALDSSAILDGFTIRDGNANAGSQPHNSGGGMYNYSHSPKIANCTFTNNYAYFGGGMRNREGSPIINVCVFSENRADDGGALFNSSNSHAVLTGCTFTSNKGESGGAVQNNLSNPRFLHCDFGMNMASTYGGAVQNQQTGSPEFINCSFWENVATDGGGAIVNDSASNAAYYNCLVYANSANTYGGGILNHKCTASFTNMTVVENQSYYGGGFLNDTAQISIRNSIIWGNTGTVAFQMANNGSQVAISNSCLPMNTHDTISNPASPGVLILSDVIVEYPKFFQPTTGDFTLFGNSPCVNTGNNAFNLTPTEIRGNTRIQNSYIDMGAYEWTSTVDPDEIHQIVYVDSARVDDTGDGFSWAGAKKSLQAGLDLVVSGDQVWVKKGTYYPSSFHGFTPDNNRLMHFRMKPGVAIYGSLAGTEAPGFDMDLRDLTVNRSILSGDINTLNDPADNVYHVFYHPSGLGLASTAILDGFIIRDGNANGSGIHTHGGGMHSNTNSPLIQNCIFTNNNSSAKGGASYFYSGTLSFLKCQFTDNVADEGAGFYLESTASVTLKSCLVQGNQTTANAGGGFLVNTGGTLNVINSLLTGNSSVNFGGGLYLHTGAAATFTNCTFSKNHAAYGGGAYTNGTSLIFNNSILWGNSSSQWGNQIETSGSAGTVLNYSCYSNVYDNSKGIWDVEGNVSSTSPININPGFEDIDNNVFILKGNSPCVNTGLSTYNSEPEDIRGEARIQGSSIDMGAYEYTPGTDPAKTDLFVKHDATGTNNGSDWGNAFTVLQSALNKSLIPGDAIWVAKGTYFPTYAYGMGGGRFNHFRMVPGVKIYGGLAGTEDVTTTDLNARDYILNETVLSGDLGNLSDTSDNAYHIFYHPDGLGLDTTSTLDGFTLSAGIATGENDHGHGPGVFNRNNNPSLKNCLIRDNFAKYDGGGVYNDGSSPDIVNCFFVFDSCTYSGGAVYNRGGSNPRMINSVFARTKAIYGGAIFSQNSNLLINNCTFAGNGAYTGGGMMAEGSDPSTININNSIFWGNTGWSLEGQQIYLKENVTMNINHSCYSDDPGDIYDDATFSPVACISSYPGFVEPGMGDFRIASCSPCVDEGDNAAVHLALDFRKENRVQNIVIDMGAYEYTAGTDPYEVRAVSGSLTRTPDQDHVCIGSDVSASLVAGTGGDGTDTCMYRTQNGAGWSSWSGYVPESPISTTGKTSVEIRTYRDSDYGVIGDYVTVAWIMDSVSIGGTVAGGVHVCTGTNSTLLSLSGQRGTVDKWQFSEDDGATWNDIATATSTTYTAENLVVNTLFRAAVSNGVCDASYSLADTVIADPASVGGTTSGGTTVCPGTNSTELTLSDHTGSVVKWQYQEISDGSGGGGWIDIGSSSSTSYTAVNLTTATKYRAVVKSGACSSAYSSESTIDVETPPVSGTLTKVPNVSSVCDGNDVSATLTAGSGGNLTDVLEYRTQAGSVWGSWVTYTSGASISTTGVNLVEVQTYREADYCDDATANKVSWTIDPPTNAGAVTGGTSVCIGTNSTLLTLSGHTGAVQKWQYSINNSDWTDLASQTQTTYTAVNVSQDTWYRAVVKSGDCLPVPSEATQITILSDFKISGYARYENNPHTALSGLKITLKQGVSTIGTPYITGSNGYYEFPDLSNGTYDLTIESANPGGWLTWGGVTNTDYLLVANHISGTQLLPLDPPVVRITASVKVPHPAINTIDATAIRQAAKYPLTGYTFFDIPKWVFSGTTGATALTGITVACSDITRDIRGLCAGDVNGTFVPPSGVKTVQVGTLQVETLHATSLQLVHRGVLPLSDEIVIPVRMDRNMELGAITLFLDYDPAKMEIAGVEMPVNGGVEPWFDVSGGVLMIGWWSMEPVTVSENDILMLIRARIKDVVSVKENIRFTLNEEYMSELANGLGEVISKASLIMPEAGSKSANLGNENAVNLRVFPNPVKESLFVEYSAPVDGLIGFELLNSQGIIVMKTDLTAVLAGTYREPFDVSSYAAGVYMLRATIGPTVKLVKVVIY